MTNQNNIYSTLQFAKQNRKPTKQWISAAFIPLHRGFDIRLAYSTVININSGTGTSSMCNNCRRGLK